MKSCQSLGKVIDILSYDIIRLQFAKELKVLFSIAQSLETSNEQEEVKDEKKKKKAK
jgi:hypothetical protein